MGSRVECRTCLLLLWEVARYSWRACWAPGEGRFPSVVPRLTSVGGACSSQQLVGGDRCFARERERRDWLHTHRLGGRAGAARM